jgi:hypothetical protein
MTLSQTSRTEPCLVYEKNELYEGCAEIVTAVKYLKEKDIKKK